MKQENHEEKKSKPKRPDVAARLLGKREYEEKVVSCSLPKRLGHALDDDCRLLLSQEIDRWVLSTSQVVHRLSLVFNRLLLFLMNRDLPLPSFTDAFFSGLALSGMKKSRKTSKEGFSRLIDDFIENEFNVEYGQYPEIKRQRGDCQAIVIASSRYKTNFKNTIHIPFYTRQFKYIKTWICLNGFDLTKRRILLIQNQINGCKEINEENPDLLKFIRKERAILGNPIDMDMEWLSKRIPVVLKYYFHILRYYTEKEQGKKFRLAPLCQIKSHFLTIDNTVLREILVNVRREASRRKIPFPEWIGEKMDQKKIKQKKESNDKDQKDKKKESNDMDLMVWKGIFNYEGLRRRRTFSNRIDTDGTKVCFHFRVAKKVRGEEKRKKEKNRKKKKKRYTKPRRVIAVDPGRVNLIMAYDSGNNKYYRLTRGYYYRACGMKHLVKKINRRNLEQKGIYDAMSRSPTKSIREEDWYEYQQVINRNYDILWRENATEQRRRENFRVKRLKEKCLDQFFNQWKTKGEESPLVAYGAASMNPTGRGELAVPVKYVYEKCRLKFETVKVDERNTTKRHHRCKGRTGKVKVGLEYTRGLRWCPTCSELVSRDRNACKNILRAYEAEERPRYLCDTKRGRREACTKVLREVKSYTTTITERSS